MTILRALVYSADEKPGNNFYTRHWHFFFRNVRIVGFSVFYRVANLPFEKVCIIKNFEAARRDLEKYNWPQKTCTPFNSKSPGANWSVVQRRKWSPTADDPQTRNDPQIGLQMIPNRKWSPMWTATDPVGKRGMAWNLFLGWWFKSLT